MSLINRGRIVGECWADVIVLETYFIWGQNRFSLIGGSLEINTTCIMNMPCWIKAFSKKPSTKSASNCQKQHHAEYCQLLSICFLRDLASFLHYRNMEGRRGPNSGTVSVCILLFRASSWKTSIFSLGFHNY